MKRSSFNMPFFHYIFQPKSAQLSSFSMEGVELVSRVLLVAGMSALLPNLKGLGWTSATERRHETKHFTGYVLVICLIHTNTWIFMCVYIYVSVSVCNYIISYSTPPKDRNVKPYVEIVVTHSNSPCLSIFHWIGLYNGFYGTFPGNLHIS